MIIRELRTKSEPPPISVISWKSWLIWIVSRFGLIGLPFSFLVSSFDDVFALTLLLRLPPLTHTSSPYANSYL